MFQRRDVLTLMTKKGKPTMPPYGDKFQVGEVVLIYFRNQPAIFARIEEIRPDKKKGWWQMTFLVLAIPLQKMTWILDDDQIRGSDFTMNGEPIRLERVAASEPFVPQAARTEKKQNKPKANGGTVISMFGEE